MRKASVEIMIVYCSNERKPPKKRTESGGKETISWNTCDDIS
jgi:hypothetical protein